MTLEIRSNELIFNGVTVAYLDPRDTYKLDDAAKHLDALSEYEDALDDDNLPKNTEELEELESEAKERGLKEGVEETLRYLTAILHHSNKTFFSNEKWMQELGESIRENVPFCDEIPKANGPLMSAFAVDIIDSVISDDLDNLNYEQVIRGADEEIKERNQGMARQAKLDASLCDKNLIRDDVEPTAEIVNAIIHT